MVVGATGNLGSAVVNALAAEDGGEFEVIGVSRRPPSKPGLPMRWVGADITRDSLEKAFEGADAVIHLAWAIQPVRRRRLLWTTNVEGSLRVFDAAVRAGAKAVLYASSVGAYSPGPKGVPVDESWPTNGVPTSSYSVQKAYVERSMDRYCLEHPDVRFVRMRPGLVFSRDAAGDVRRYFLGGLVPTRLLAPPMIKFLPAVAGLSLQIVHSSDVGEAFRLALSSDVSGAFNLAADPVIDSEALSVLLGAKMIRLPASVLSAAAKLSWALRLQPTEPGWLDMGLSVPTMATQRAREELGWQPKHGAGEALLELLWAMGGTAAP